MKRRREGSGRWKLAVVLAVGIAGMLAAAFAVSGGARWRLQLLALKVTGETPELRWDDLVTLLKPGSGVWPHSLWTTRNPYLAVKAPWTTPADIDEGRALYNQHCLTCHSDGRLMSGLFVQGASDLALFQTLRHGVAGTSMRSSALDTAGTWRVVAYLQQSISDGRASLPETARAGTWPSAARPASPELAQGQWTAHHGTNDGQHYSGLSQIDRRNVARLRPVWQFPVPGEGEALQVTPVVSGGMLFVSVPEGDVWALDTRSGALLWHHAGRALPADLYPAIEGNINRGVATDGSAVYATSLDGRLRALAAKTGQLLWDVKVADYPSGYRLTGAPLVVKGAVVVGMAGADRGIRGFIDAYSARDGKRLWRFDTVSGWENSAAAERGGGATSTTGTYDPRLELIYWGVGNPTPAFEGDIRPGDNLYTSSLVAIEAKSGRLRWHYQVAAHDERDWGATHVPVLADVMQDGQPRQLVHLASRNGFLYTLDRETGRFIHAHPYVRQTWNQGFSPDGKAIEVPHSRPSRRGTLIYPGHAGGTGWMAPAYDPHSGLFMVVTRVGYGNVYYKSPRLYWPDGAYWGGQATHLQDAAMASEVRALVAQSGELRWAYRFHGDISRQTAGLLATAGGVVFAGANGRMVALDSSDGRELWHFDAGGAIDAAYITYLAGERQLVTVVARRTVFTFAVPP